MLINVTGSSDMTLFEVDEAANRIRDEVDPEANIIVGSTFDTDLTGSVRVSVVATGIDVAEFSKPKSQALGESEKSVRIESNNINEKVYSSRDVSLENENKNEDLTVNRESLHEENKNLEPTASDLTSANFSFSEENKNSDKIDHEKQMESPPNQPASEIDLPPRRQNNEPSVSGGGLNNLIRRMTGFGDKREQEDNIATKSQLVEEEEGLKTDREDESKLEIPAFLRRQAN